jgi:hypothetical protein
MVKSNVYKVTNDKFLRFNVKLVEVGATYGKDQCLTNTEKPLVEFYDATYAGKEGFDAEGQFISRYDVDSLLSNEKLLFSGLVLNGGIPEWRINDHNVGQVFEWLDDIGYPIRDNNKVTIELTKDELTYLRYALDDRLENIDGGGSEPHSKIELEVLKALSKRL